jgi:subfamily B ATP-binding cassette protein HlyB/CyaB
LNNNTRFAADTFLWGLGAICQLHRQPFARHLILQQFAPPYTLACLQEATQALKVKSSIRAVALSEFHFLPQPFLTVLKPRAAGKQPDPPRGPDTARSEPLPNRLAVVLKCDAERILYATENSSAPVAATLKEFGEEFAGMVVLCAPEPPALGEADEALVRPREFGFKWFVPELLKHKNIWRDVLLASLAIQFMALATPLFTQVVIDKVVVHRTMNTLIVIGIALAVVMIFSAAMSWVRQYLVLHTGNRVDAVLGTQVFEHVLRLPIRYFEHRPTGVVVARLHAVETIREFVSGAAVTLILDCPFLVIFLAIMFCYSWLLSLITLAILAAIVAISFAIVPSLRARVNQQFLLGARNSAFLTEYISGMETVKSLQMEPQLKSRFGDYLASYLAAGFNTRQLANTYNVAANTLEQLLTLSILCAGAWLVMGNEGFTIGMLVAYQMFASRLSQPMLRLAGLWQEFQQTAIAVKRLGDIMNAPAEPHSVTPSRSATSQGRVEIADLSFRYGESLPYLFEHLNLELKPGACLALMGPSGSGKSTLAKLLQGFYLPTHGQIKLDNRDVRGLPANEIRSHFGVVPQETMLFSGTIYENLTLANPHATFEHVIQACKMAEIHDTIEQLPEGYQTPIGEHGAGLSGGQKQRVAIARALLKRPKILIFDEATSSLDQPTAEQFARTVNQFKGKVTMLFIAHQLPNGLQVDEVIKLGGHQRRMSVVTGDKDTNNC